MKGAAALWIVYPKGKKHITENDVLAAGRKVGLKDVKVVGFSSTQHRTEIRHPALREMRPSIFLHQPVQFRVSPFPF